MGKSRYGLAVVLLPPLVTLIVLFVLPIASMGAYSFWSVDNDYQLVTEPTLGQYQKVFSSGILLEHTFQFGCHGVLHDACLRRHRHSTRLGARTEFFGANADPAYRWLDPARMDQCPDPHLLDEPGDWRDGNAQLGVDVCWHCRDAIAYLVHQARGRARARLHLPSLYACADLCRSRADRPDHSRGS